MTLLATLPAYPVTGELVRRCVLCEGPLDAKNEVAADGQPWHLCCERAVSLSMGLKPLTAADTTRTGGKP